MVLITGCTDGSEYIISLNETITPPDLISASSFVGSPFRAPPRNVLHFGYDKWRNLYTWCTNTEDTNPVVTINFTMPVVITKFLSSGSTYIPLMITAYTTNFTVEYTQRSTNGDLNFVYYKTETDSKAKVRTHVLMLLTHRLIYPPPPPPYTHACSTSHRMSLSNSFNSRGQLSPIPYDLDLSNRLILLLVLIENLM